MIGQLCESLGLVGLFMVFIVLVDLGIMIWLCYREKKR